MTTLIGIIVRKMSSIVTTTIKLCTLKPETSETLYLYSLA